MKPKLPHRFFQPEHGSALVVVMMLGGIIAILLAGLAQYSGTRGTTQHTAKLRSTNYYTAESEVNAALSWLRDHSQDVALPFRRDKFYTNFARATTPSSGANEGALFSVPTRIKMLGSNNSVMLANDATLGTSAFPTTANIITGASFNSLNSFQSASFGGGKVRLTLVDALPVDPSQDFGPPPAAAPSTDFYPVYRIDGVTGKDLASHVFGYVLGSMFYVDTVGFYGRDGVTFTQPCDSYVSANGNYSSASKRPHCPIGSNGPISVHQNTSIYGSLRTNGSIDPTSPYGGKVCSDFTSGCPNTGTSCQGASCGVPGLPTFQAWNSYCPSNQGNLTVAASGSLTVGGNGANQKCWSTVSINSNRTLTLSTTAYPYFFDTLTLQNNSNSKLNIQPSPNTGTVQLYVRTITGDQINGNQLFNTNNRPVQLRMYYLGTNALTLNGNAQMNVALVAPYADVTVSGNFTFQGGILAKRLTVSGSASVHYDESLGGSVLNDSNYRLKNEVQRYH